MEKPGERRSDVYVVAGDATMEKIAWTARFAAIRDEEGHVRIALDAAETPWPCFQIARRLFAVFSHTKRPRKGSYFPTDKDTSFFLGAGTLTYTHGNTAITFDAPDCEEEFGHNRPLDADSEQQIITDLRSAIAQRVRTALPPPASVPA